jgi:hypothetical protein
VVADGGEKVVRPSTRIDRITELSVTTVEITQKKQRIGHDARFVNQAQDAAEFAAAGIGMNVERAQQKSQTIDTQLRKRHHATARIMVE